MKILIVYGSTEGQTRKIARYAADRFAAEGHAVELLPAAEAEDVAVEGFDAVLAAGSIHAGHYQESLFDFVERNADALAGVKTLFLSVSLSAAGDDPDDWRGIEECATRFCEATGWSPGRVEHVAGALKFSEYDFFRYWAMRWIASRKDEEAKPGEDKEYTDWSKLAAVLDDWAAGS